MPALTEADLRSVAPEAESSPTPKLPPEDVASTPLVPSKATYYYLGYFTGIELVVMAIGTLLGALLVYVLLETL
jgi:hypothetical protein